MRSTRSQNQAQLLGRSRIVRTNSAWFMYFGLRIAWKNGIELWPRQFILVISANPKDWANSSMRAHECPGINAITSVKTLTKAARTASPSSAAA